MCRGRFGHCRAGGIAPPSGVQIVASGAASDWHDVEATVDSTDVVGVRGNHAQSPLACGDRYRRVSYVVSGGRSAELPDRSSGKVVERDDLTRGRAQQSREADLGSTVPPRLGHHASGHDEGITVLESPHHDRDDSTVVAVEPNERTGIQDCAAQRPSARSAALRSFALRAPPVSASISSRSDARSSSFAFSSRASAT